MSRRWRCACWEPGRTPTDTSGPCSTAQGAPGGAGGWDDAGLLAAHRRLVEATLGEADGVLIAESREFMTTAWWLPLFPGLAIALVGIAFSLLGDGLSGLVRRSER